MKTNKMKLEDFCFINPRIFLKKGEKAKKIAMTDLPIFSRKINSYTYQNYNGGTKFQNGDTLIARITPCLENGKSGYVDILEESEVAFGSTEYIVFREIYRISYSEYIYYFVNAKEFRDIAIKSMTGTSGRQRVQTEVLAKTEFEFPNVDAQQKIAYILSLLDKKIEINNVLNDNLAELARIIYKKLFTACTEDDLQDTCKLSDIADIVMGQSPSGSSYNEDGNEQL